MLNSDLAWHLNLALCCAGLCCISVLVFSQGSWVWVGDNNQVRTRPRSNFGIERALEDKYRERSDPGDCVIDGVYLPPFCLPGLTQNESKALARTLPNQLKVVVFVGIQPKIRTLAPMLTDVLSTEWDERLDNLDFFLSSNYDRYYKGRIREYDKAAMGKSNGSVPSATVNKGGRILEAPYSKTPRRLRRKLAQRTVVNMFHVETDSDVVEKHKLRWWWVVNLTYLAYWRDDNSSMSQEIMEIIHKSMTVSFAGFRLSVEAVIQNLTNDTLFRLRSLDDGIPSEEVDNLDIGPTILNLDDSHQKSMDTYPWAWSQYFGLGLLVGTVAISLLLQYLSLRRLRARTQHHNWGNLASRNGLDDLLNTAWTLEGNMIKIYDKTNMGYNDDDSLFLGGFEQRETVVGTEITIATPATTDSGSGTIFSHRHSELSHSVLNHEQSASTL